MASSPEYLAPRVHNTDTLDIDIDPAITGVPNGSCSSIPPSTVSYSPDPNTYSEVSHISSFDASPIIDERLLTPVSSAASPLLQQHQRSSSSSCCCPQSPFNHHHHHHHTDESTTAAAQQPTPPHTASMYPYPDYLGNVVISQPAPSASSSSPSPCMPMPAADSSSMAESSQQHHHHHQQHAFLPPHHHHNHHDDDNNHPPPPPNPYFGSYTVSVPQEHDQHQHQHHDQHHQQQQQYYHLGPHATDLGPLGLVRGNVHSSSSSTSTGTGGAYTLRPLAPLSSQPTPPPPMFSLTTLDPYQHRLPRLLSPTTTQGGRHYAVPRARRDRKRKASALRRGGAGGRAGSSSSSFSPPGGDGVGGVIMLPHGGHGQHVEVGEEEVEEGGPDVEVTLDEKTPADLRRLWETRRKWLGKKGNGMWEDIMVDYMGNEHLTENKKTQVKAMLQMKIHRMLLKHGKWPERDESALLRAYRRWEENRYVEILRMYEEEMAGRKKAYEWKSQHIEAQLIKMGLEEPERDRDSKARKRKQVAARHQTRTAGAGAGAASLQLRLPGMYEPAAPPYGHYAPPQTHYDQQQQQQPQQPQRTPSYDAAFTEQISVQPPTLSDEQNDQLAREILERNPFAENGDEDDDDDDDGDGGLDVDIKMELSDYGSSDLQQRPRAASLVPGLNMGPSAPQQRLHSSTASPDINAQRSLAVARQACGKLLEHQHFQPDIDA